MCCCRSMKISLTSLGLINCLKIIHPPDHVLFPATTVITKRYWDEPLEISTLICMGIGGSWIWVHYTNTSSSASQVMLSLLWICWRSQHDKTCWICFVTLRSPKPWCPHYALDMIGKPSMSRGCTKWFCYV